MNDFLKTLAARELTTPDLRSSAGSTWIAPRVASIFEPVAQDAMRGGLSAVPESMRDADESGTDINQPAGIRDAPHTRIADRSTMNAVNSAPVSQRSAAQVAEHSAIKLNRDSRDQSHVLSAEDNTINNDVNSAPTSRRSAAKVAEHSAVKPNLDSCDQIQVLSAKDNTINLVESKNALPPRARVTASARNAIAVVQENSTASSPAAHKIFDASDPISAPQLHVRFGANARDSVATLQEDSTTSSPASLAARTDVTSSPVSPIPRIAAMPFDANQQARSEFRQTPIVPRAIDSMHSESPLDRNDRSGTTERTINITIGRIEVRAVAAPPTRAPAATRSAAKPMSLDEYLLQRNRRGA